MDNVGYRKTLISDMVILRKEVYQMIGTPLLSIISFISLMFSKRREDNPSSSHSLSHVHA